MKYLVAGILLIWATVSNAITLMWDGSGFFINKDGYILTAKHVVDDPSLKYTVTTITGKVCLAKVVFLAPNDSAVIKVDPSCTKGTATLGLDPNMPIGETVYTNGFALSTVWDSKQILVKGIISAFTSSYVVVDMTVFPGHSGGPIFNSAGNVVGVVSGVWATAKGAMMTGISNITSVSFVKYMLDALHIDYKTYAPGTSNLSTKLAIEKAQAATVLIAAFSESDNPQPIEETK